MGLYPMTCAICEAPFMWFSGNVGDQRCPRCLESDSLAARVKELESKLAKTEEALQMALTAYDLMREKSRE